MSPQQSNTHVHVLAAVVVTPQSSGVRNLIPNAAMSGSGQVRRALPSPVD